MVTSITMLNQPLSRAGSQPDQKLLRTGYRGVYWTSTAVEHPWSSVTFILLPADTAIPGRKKFSLRRGLFVEMSNTNDGFVIGASELNEESYGATFEEAYFDFLTSLRDRYLSLSRREEKLSNSDKLVLEKLRSLLHASRR